MTHTRNEMGKTTSNIAADEGILDLGRSRSVFLSKHIATHSNCIYSQPQDSLLKHYDRLNNTAQILKSRAKPMIIKARLHLTHYQPKKNV